jgi:hypothetical protein
MSILTADEIKDLVQVLNYRYANHLAGRHFEMQICPESDTIVRVVVKLLNENQSFYYPVETRIDTKDQNISQRDATHLLIDYIDYYWEEYFKGSESVFLPIDWQNYVFESAHFQMRGQVQNLYHEQLADAILEGRAV